MIGEGIKELLFTSDNYHGLQKQSLAMPDGRYFEKFDWSLNSACQIGMERQYHFLYFLTLIAVLQTINFGGNAWERLKEIKQVQVIFFLYFFLVRIFNF